MPEVICNTSPIQYLHQINLLHLLPDLYERIIIQEAVVTEIGEGRRTGVDLPDVARLPWIKVEEVRVQNLLRMVSALGPGEREVLALALEAPGALVILDDLPARRYASFLKLRLTGTLGILLKAKHMGSISSVAPILDKLESLRFRLDAKTRQAVIKLSGEM